MNRSFLMAMLLMGVALLAVALTPAPDEEEEAVRAAIAHYFQGHATGNGAHFEKVFHPQAKLFWIRDGRLNQRTSAEYIAGASGTPPADEAQHERRIADIDITGNAAIVKVELDYPGAFITDYISMLKIEGRWQIVNKTFMVELKEE